MDVTPCACDTMSHAHGVDIQKDTVSLPSDTDSPRSYSLQGLLCTSKAVQKALSTLLIHCKVTCIAEFLTINNIFNLKFPFLWPIIVEIMRVMKSTNCQLLSIQ